LLGAAVASAGLLGPPFVIVSVIGFVYARFGEIAALQRMLIGVAAAAVGLVLGTCAKMALPLLRDRFGIAPLIVLATFASVGILRWPLPWALAVLVPLSIAIAWVRR
jgi:chromate transporter